MGSPFPARTSSLRTALGKEGKEGKGVEERPASALSSLSYRKRLALKDSIGGAGDAESLFSTLSERAASPERPPRKARPGPRAEPEERGSVSSEAGGRASRGLEKRWGSDFDGASTTVSAPVSRASSATRRGSGEDGARSSVSVSLSGSPSSRRSASRLDGLPRAFSPSWSRASGLGRDSPDSRLSLGRGRLDEWDDGASVALSEAHCQYGPPSLARSLSVPQPRASSAAASAASAAEEPVGSSSRPASRHSYLDPDLEAAINEVLSYKPVPFQRTSLEPDSEDDRKSIRSARSAQLASPEPATGMRRSASAADVSRSRSRGGRKSRSKRRSSSSASSSSSSSEDSSGHRRRRKKGRSRKSKKKSKSRRKRAESETESSSSSGSTVSGHSRSSVKKGPAVDGEQAGRAPRPARKEEEKRKKEVDSLMMRYLYRPESD